MLETRRSPRYLVLKVGSIEFGGGAIDCTVRNISATGAAIEVEGQTGIPARFILVVPGYGLQLPCHIVWRRPYRIGVVFD